MTNFHVVTCFGPGGWDKYARNFHTSFVQHVKGATLHTYFHDCEKPEGLVATDLATTPNWPDFKKKFGHMNGDGNWRFDVAKFGNKVFAIADALNKLKEAEDAVLIWLDSDIFFKATPDLEMLFPKGHDFYSLVRANTFIESSVMGFRCGTLAEQLVWDVEELYSIGGFQRFTEWHDGYVYDAMATVMAMHGMRGFSWANNANGPGADAFNTSVWADYATHDKGDKKETKRDIAKREIEKNFDAKSIHFALATDSDVLKQECELAHEDVIVILEVEKFKPLFNSLGDAKWKRVILQTGKGDVGLLVKHHVPQKTKSAQVRIQPQDCVSSEETHKNIDRNFQLLSRWLEPCCVNSEEVVIVSAGPSTIEQMDKIREFHENGKKIFAVKHSYPTLINAGIIPWACVVLDPRPYEGISTHGVQRSSLFRNVNPLTLFFVATMGIPELTEDLIKKGAQVIGFHAFSDASKKYPWPPNTTLVSGGTCAALRAIGVAHTMGFRTVHMFGFDFSQDEITPAEATDKDESGRQKWFKVSTSKLEGKRHFYSTGELMAGAQNLETLARSDGFDMTFYMYGDGLGQNLFREAGYLPRKHYTRMLATMSKG